MSPGRAAGRILRHWLLFANGLTALTLGLPFAAPILMHSGQAEPANWIYAAFQVTCHEWPFRSYFLFGPQATYSLAELQSYGVDSVYRFRGSPELGYKVAFCARNVAIYAGLLLGGLLYGRGKRWRPLSVGGYGLLVAPMAVDGLSQLVGLRESNWELRTLTGLLFGAASVWLLYPRIDGAIRATTTPLASSREPVRA